MTRERIAIVAGAILIAVACWLSMTAWTRSLAVVSEWLQQPDHVTGDKSWARQHRELLYQSTVMGRLTASGILGLVGLGLFLVGLVALRPAPGSLTRTGGD